MSILRHTYGVQHFSLSFYAEFLLFTTPLLLASLLYSFVFLLEMFQSYILYVCDDVYTVLTAYSRLLSHLLIMSVWVAHQILTI